MFKLTENIFNIRMESRFSNTNLIKQKINIWIIYDSSVDRVQSFVLKIFRKLTKFIE